MIKCGDIVRNAFGVMYEVIECDSLVDMYRICHVGDHRSSSKWIEAAEISGWDVFRKVNTCD